MSVIMSPCLLPFGATPGPLLQSWWAEGQKSLLPFLPDQAWYALPLPYGDFNLAEDLAAGCASLPAFPGTLLVGAWCIL